MTGSARAPHEDSFADKEPTAPAAVAPGLPEPGTSLHAAVLALQRTHGNASVNRMLAARRLLRQPEPAQEDETGQRGPTRIDRDDVLITTVFGPELRAAGEYEWRVTYGLPFPATGDGYMIQELYMESSGAQESGGVRGTHFWECWRVRRGQREPEERINGYDDRYRFLNISEQSPSGWKRHVGVIRFYPGPLPQEFGPESSDVHFYTTHTQPSGWTGQGTRHDAYSEWNARRRPPLNGLVVYAGTRETRRGDRIAFRPR